MSMRLIAACKVCGVPVVRCEGLGSHAAQSMRAHLDEAHPEYEPGARVADLLRWFDVFRAAA
jgi:hypothetical protein